MRKQHVAAGLAALLVTAIVVWIARHTEWRQVTVPMPLRGEAARNPMYAAQRLAEALGARTERGEGLELPSTDAAVLLTSWSWDISAGRRERFEQWVEAGGRLVVDRSLFAGSDAFEEWSGIRFATDDNPAASADVLRDPSTLRVDRCAEVSEDETIRSAYGRIAASTVV